MDNKLSELGKTVAYDYQIAGACIADGNNKKWVDWINELSHECPPAWMIDDGKVTDLKPLYSQEYVSALDEVAQFWIGESAGWKKRAEDAEKRIAELEDAEQKLCAANVTLDARASSAEAKLATPVRLPRRAPENLASVLDGYEKWLIATTFRDTWNACLDEVSRVSSGFTVEGGE